MPLDPDGVGTRLSLSYVIGGYVRGGADTLAPKVDDVLAVRLLNLKTFAEAVAPAAAPARSAKRSEPGR